MHCHRQPEKADWCRWPCRQARSFPVPRFGFCLGAFLPPFSSEFEIGVTYTIDGKGIATLATPSKPLGRALDEYAATGAPHDIARLVSLVQVKTETFDIEASVARGWLNGFWRSLSDFAHGVPRLALKGDGTREVEVTLDATIYKVFYSDTKNHLRVSIPGPDPDWQGDRSKLAPVVRWVLDVRQQILKLASARGPATPSKQESLQKFLQEYLKSPWGEEPTTRYVAAFTDLNGDGEQEAIVYVSGREWCGSGGCVLLVLTPQNSSYKLVTRMTITRPPIRVLDRMSNGWHDLAVWVVGGGITRGYEAGLSFDGATYPTNPSVPPSQRLTGRVPGKTVITSTQKRKQLYP